MMVQGAVDDARAWSDRSDEDLIGAIRSGASEPLGVLVARWERPLFRFVFRLLPSREEAQDICQETFLRVLRRADRFRTGSKFSTWMYHIALNLCRDHQRKRRRWGLLVVDGGVDEAGRTAPERAADRPWDPDDDLDRQARREAVGRALDAIPPEQREVLVLKEFEGLRFREIAEIVGCPESTIKSRMYYGLKGLRTALVRSGWTADGDRP